MALEPRILLSGTNK
ncbi:MULTISPECIES: LEPR-XLL domain-containing protein [Nostoc]